jgi:hypothetical protein
MQQQIIELKGGSLNSTALHITPTHKFVRKIISTKANREYGYVRWYSQLKKLQRFNTVIPNYVPKVIDCGVLEQGAYFDIEYIESQDIKTLFKENKLSKLQVDKMHNALWTAFDALHSHTYRPNTSSLKLYFVEEVLQKLNDARQFSEFEQFYQIDNYLHQGHQVLGMKTLMDKFSKLFDQSIISESLVHGNPTLENVLYNPTTDQITFIDLYEEGIVDSKFADYSQVLQCSSSLYGITNDSPITVVDNTTQCNFQVSKELDYFDSLFKERLKTRCTEQEYYLVKLFEATQFFRMLPFKCHAGNIDGAKFFYAHACSLVNRLL